MEIFKAFIGLYVDVFKKYPLAASITTLLFVVGWYIWTRINKERSIEPDAVWKRPAFALFIGWCILTPLLGFIINTLSFLKNVLTALVGLYVHVFKMYPEAAAIVTIVFMVVYFIWRAIIKKWAPRSTGFWSHPFAILLLAWLAVTPIFGFILKTVTVEREPVPHEERRGDETATSQTSGMPNKPDAGDG